MDVRLLYQKYHRISVVAAHLDVSRNRARKMLLEAGVHLVRGRPFARYNLPDDEIASRYLAGETCKEIAASYEMKDSPKPHEIIRSRLKNMGIARRQRGAHKKRNASWNGGKYQAPMHYYRRLSYEIAAICLGKPTPAGSVIHHLDENPMNNNPENLILFPAHRNHAKFHAQLKNRRRAGLATDSIQFAKEIGGQELQRPSSLNGCELRIDQHDLSKKDQRGGRGRKGFGRFGGISRQWARQKQ